MTPDEIRSTARTAIDRFNDPARRDEYFDVSTSDDVVLDGYTPSRSRSRPPSRGAARLGDRRAPRLRWSCARELAWRGMTLTIGQRVAGTVTLAPVGGTVPPGVSRGPSWVPRQVTSCATVLPSARTRSTVPCTSGSASFQPWQRAR